MAEKAATETDCFDYLRRAQGAADEIARRTASLYLSGVLEDPGAEIEAFDSLMDARAPLVREMTRFRDQADKAFENIKDAARRADFLAARRALNQRVEEIIAADRRQREIMEQIKEKVTATLREIRGGQKIFGAYAPEDGEAVFFDVKQ